MPEQVGIKKVGTTMAKELLSSTSDALEFTSVTLAGGSNATYPMGRTLKDGTDGLKVVYTNADVSPTGVCILAEDVVTTTESGNVTTFALIKGNVKTSMVKDATGALADAAFKALMPMVRFE